VPLFPIYSAHSVHLILFGPFVQVQNELLLLLLLLLLLYLSLYLLQL